MELTQNAIQVLNSRYLVQDAQTGARETPEQLFIRVSTAVSLAEKRPAQKKWASKFFDLMWSGKFLPNSPTLMNAGKTNGQLSACFVLPLEDSLESIFDTLKATALIHQSGGGTGFSFSKIRAKGSKVSSTHGVASGPMAFLKIFDQTTEVIKQGGTRRGANMAVLRVDHPDIMEFIRSKRDLRSITNFNISVGITDSFMQGLTQGRGLEIWESLIESAWSSGDPGLVFLDRISMFNPTPREGDMESTNPCGEQPLLPFESCNLGSLNVRAYVKDNKRFDWAMFERDVSDAVRFLDNVIDCNAYPVKQCEKITKKNRKIGLGVMGFADALLAMGVLYDSEPARDFGEVLMSSLDRGAKSASAKLAKERGAFKGFKGSMWDRLGYPEMRNATVSTVAPTGTISLIAGVSGGIEPNFSKIFYRNVLSGARLREEHPLSASPVWQSSHEVSVEGHVKMQGRFQRHSDSAVSKTINLPANAAISDVDRAYKLAYFQGCKGITVFRDGCKGSQVLESASNEDTVEKEKVVMCPEC